MNSRYFYACNRSIKYLQFGLNMGMKNQFSTSINNNMIRKNSAIYFDQNIKRNTFFHPFLGKYELKNVDNFNYFHLNTFTLSLKLDKCSFTNESIGQLKNILEGPQYISNLVITEPKNVGTDMNTLFDRFSVTQRPLSNIHLSGFEFNDEQISSLCKLIAANKFKKSINLTKNLIPKENFQMLIDSIIESAKTLEELSIVDCNLDEEMSLCLKDIILQCSLIKSFSIKGNPDMGKGLTRIFKELGSSNVRKIDFSSCNISEEQATILGESLSKLNELESIEINFNDKMYKGFDNIIQGLQSCREKLQYLGIGHCKLESNQKAYILETLGDFRSLKGGSFDGDSQLEKYFQEEFEKK